MTEPSTPRRGVARVAFTPAADPTATVIAEGHLVAAADTTPAARRAAMQRCTRFSAPPDWHLVVAFLLPQAVASAVRAAGTGSLHVWTWADPSTHTHEHEPFLSWWMPRATLAEDDPAADRMVLRLDAGALFSLPYLTDLPAHERPASAGWAEEDRQVVWPVNTVPAVTPVLEQR